MKKKWVKPEMKFDTDPDIILECIYEVYGQEKHMVLSGKNIRHTMVFPFLKMLSNNLKGNSGDLEGLHKHLWSIYQKKLEKQEFVRQCQEILDVH